MNADEAAAGTDEALESSLLGAGQDVAGRGEKHDGLVAREVGAREGPRIFGRVDAEAVPHAELADGANRYRNGRVPKPGGLREDEHAGTCSGAGRGFTRSDRLRRPEDEDQRCPEPPLQRSRVLPVAALRTAPRGRLQPSGPTRIRPARSLARAPSSARSCSEASRSSSACRISSDVSRVDVPDSGAADLREARDRGGDAGRTRGHRLQQRQAEALVERRVAEDGAGLVEGAEILVGDLAEDADAVPARRFQDRLVLPPARADERELDATARGRREPRARARGSFAARACRCRGRTRGRARTGGEPPRGRRARAGCRTARLRPAERLVPSARLEEIAPRGRDGSPAEMQTIWAARRTPGLIVARSINEEERRAAIPGWKGTRS